MTYKDLHAVRGEIHARADQREEAHRCYQRILRVALRSNTPSCAMCVITSSAAIEKL